MSKDRFCAIGEGEIRIAEVLSLLSEFTVFNGSVIIDQDYSTSDLLQDLKTGYDNVYAMLQGGIDWAGQD